MTRMKRSMKHVMCPALLSGLLLSAAPSLQAQVDDGVRIRWWALSTKDAEAASAFYRDLFGLQMFKHGPGRYQIQRDGSIVGSISQAEISQEVFKVSTWIVGFKVPDVPTTLAKAVANGAKVLNGATRVKTLNEATQAQGAAGWAGIEDPDGAQFLILEYDRDPGVPPREGSLVWAELWTDTPKASTAFYEDVFGWKQSTMDHPNGQYPVFRSGEKPQAGMVPINSKTMKPGWAPYAGVVNLNDTLERVTELGGRVLFQPDDSVLHGRVAVVSDPTGADFLMYQLEEKK